LVKITPWRLLNTVFILGVGIGKAVSASQGQSTAPDILDWVIGVLWALMYVNGWPINMFISAALKFL